MKDCNECRDYEIQQNRENFIISLYCFKKDVIVNTLNFNEIREKSFQMYREDPFFHHYVSLFVSLSSQKGN